MAHHEVELPRHVARGAKGGSKFSTTILMMASGREQRNINWANVRGEWDVGYGIVSREDMEEVLHFFHARWGKAHSFNFYDWAEHTVENQIVAVGDNSTRYFPLYKRYESGGYKYDYMIQKVVPGTFTGFEADNQGDNNFTSWSYGSIDNTTGEIDTGVTLGPGTQLRVERLEFYRPVRFDTDLFDVSIDFWEHFSVPQIPLVEVKL